jgi:hypothetical protein
MVLKKTISRRVSRDGETEITWLTRVIERNFCGEEEN